MLMLRRPSAFLPIAMSIAALATVMIYLAFNGPAPQADENTAAHLWQLLMAGQVPVVVFFAVTHLAESPGPTFYVLAMQVCAALMAALPVILLRW